MAGIEHFAIHAADAPALEDFNVAALGRCVLVESGGDLPGYFLDDDAGMALEIIGRPPGEPAVNQRWVCHLAFLVDDVAATRAALKARGLVFEAETAVDNDAMRSAFFGDPPRATTARSFVGGRALGIQADWRPRGMSPRHSMR